ncbi:hypothetical protein S1OALGB6SA_2251 [Olavius algarvensis spirochete endosymbiont]|nr:hypothetical protein S1OALGB6SA_2251 [Olavius algarvensis spirochete endosymbiont]
MSTQEYFDELVNDLAVLTNCFCWNPPVLYASRRYRYDVRRGAAVFLANTRRCT